MATKKVNLQKLVEVGAHFGHQARRYNPKSRDFIYSEREGIHIFDLPKTKKALEEVLDVLEEASRAGKSILLLGTKRQVKEKVKELGEELGISYVYERWLGGTLTNFEQIKKSIRKLKEEKEALESGKYKDYTKKERLDIGRSIEKQERMIGGIMELTGAPDLMIIVDTRRERAAVREARQLGVATIGIVDSNADPDMVTYPVPMNDDAKEALDYVLELFKDAIEEGRKKKK